MASHFAWYPDVDTLTVPFNQVYEFPSQGDHASKITPRISPQAGSYFKPGQTIKIDIPAQGYLNLANTTLVFDVVMDVPVEILAATVAGPTNYYTARLQNNVQSCFSRVLFRYGSNPVEDIPNYSTVVRNLTEWTAGNPQGVIDQMTITDGIGGVYIDQDGGTTYGFTNTRQKYIQGASYSGDLVSGTTTGGKGFGLVPQSAAVPAGHVTPPGMVSVTRRYQVSLALGFFTQGKLLPAKFMASQASLEITLEPSERCIIQRKGAAYAATPDARYALANVHLIPEIVEFSKAYGNFYF